MTCAIPPVDKQTVGLLFGLALFQCRCIKVIGQKQESGLQKCVCVVPYTRLYP